jgi:hypothetical protein
LSADNNCYRLAGEVDFSVLLISLRRRESATCRPPESRLVRVENWQPKLIATGPRLSVEQILNEGNLLSNSFKSLNGKWLIDGQYQRPIQRTSCTRCDHVTLATGSVIEGHSNETAQLTGRWISICLDRREKKSKKWAKP